MKKQHETREYINQYLEDREEWKKRDDIKLAEENKNINEYVVKRQERDEETAMKKKQMQEQKEKIAEKVSRLLHNSIVMIYFSYPSKLEAREENKRKWRPSGLSST